MPASPEELIAINSLLIEREAAFARVHSIESRISELLGEPYPFSAPAVELPSKIKNRAKKTTKQKGTKSKPFKPRRLNADEVAYRLTLIDKGQVIEQSATDLKHVTTLLADSLPGMKLQKVETVDLNNKSVEVLMSNDPTP
jgi:hypothetical protein